MNTKIKNFFLVGGAAFLVLVLSGCTPGGGEGNILSRGFFKSTDGGQSFSQSEGSVLAGRSILSLEINPNNNQEIFVGTSEGGLFKSPDEGKNWLADINNFKEVYDIEIIPNTSVIYIAAKQDGRGKLFKSESNGESWVDVYTEKDGSSFLTSVAFHRNNPGSIYIANSKGGLFRTDDGGASWKNLHWADSLIRKVEIDRVNPNIIYLATTNNGLLVSRDRGETFESVINRGYIYNIVVHPSREGFIYASSKDGLQRSSDAGVSWEVLNTLVRSEELVSRGLAINPKNPREIYYTSGKAFYKSTNEGETWKPVPFNASASIETIEVHPDNNQVIFLGTKNRKTGFKIVPGVNK